MEPSPFGDGNQIGSINRAQYIQPLQWSHRLSAMETAGPVLPQQRRGGFNGATAFRRWKLEVVRAHKRAIAGFNGATAFRRWKPRVSDMPTQGILTLQWSHRLSAMEHVGPGVLPSQSR